MDDGDDLGVFGGWSERALSASRCLRSLFMTATTEVWKREEFLCFSSVSLRVLSTSGVIYCVDIYRNSTSFQKINLYHTLDIAKKLTVILIIIYGDSLRRLEGKLKLSKKLLSVFLCGE